MSDTPTGVVLPLDQLLSRRDFCRSLCVGGAALVTLSACGDEPLVVQTQKDLSTSGNNKPDDLSTTPPPDLAVQPSPPDLASQGPVDLAHEQDLARAPDMANPNACPLQNVVSSGQKPAAFAMNTATLVMAANMFICRDAGGLYAVSSLCTHQQASLNSVGANGFSCPRHGSTFTLNGVNTGGPNGANAGSVADLAHFALCVDGKGNVAVSTITAVAANKRYAL